MSTTYVTVQWSRKKIIYDAVILVGVLAYVALYKVVTGAVLTGAEAVTGAILEMRAWGSCAFLMISFILMIGPLARLDRRFLPILYNRRHLGVALFFVALMHAKSVTGYYYDFGFLTRWEALFTFDVAFTSASLPFPVFGMIAFLIFFVMAVSSHDFWQKFLGPRAWKSLHMSVYAAYVFVVLHVAFGALQIERHPALVAIFVGSVAAVVVLHVLAARASAPPAAAGMVTRDGHSWLTAGSVDAIPEGRAVAVCPPSGELIAVVKHDGRLHGLRGTCAHQGGPLAEGRVIDGCLTCPWHGWQYRPDDGKSPPPFTEELPTHRVRVSDGEVLVDPEARSTRETGVSDTAHE